MAAISEAELADRIEFAFVSYSQTPVDPVVARGAQADLIASAIADFVIGRNVTVPGVQSGGSVATGEIIE